jgi:GT2 family glycosyltransferase
LRRQTFTNFETVIVANGAGDWAENLAQEFQCSTVRFDKNRGFAAAVNAGIAVSGASYIAVLNDDVVLSERWLETLAGLLDQRPEFSFCCGKILQADGRTIDNAGDALSLGGGARRLGYGRADGPEFDQPRQLLAVSGTAALFRRAVFEKIGNFDEDFISYLEDMELSIRMWRAGLRGWYVPEAVARHHGGASLSAGVDGGQAASVFEQLTRNQLALLARHYPAALLLRLAPRVAWAQFLWAGMAIRRRRVWAYLRGILRSCLACTAAAGQRQRWTRQQKRNFLAWLRESETAISDDIAARPREQQDTYWRLYFALFRPERTVTASSPELDAKAKPNANASLRSG